MMLAKVFVVCFLLEITNARYNCSFAEKKLLKSFKDMPLTSKLAVVKVRTKRIMAVFPREERVNQLEAAIGYIEGWGFIPPLLQNVGRDFLDYLTPLLRARYNDFMKELIEIESVKLKPL